MAKLTAKDSWLRRQDNPYVGEQQAVSEGRLGQGVFANSRRRPWIVMLALVGSMICGCASSPSDPWWGEDKAAHLAVSTVLSAAATRQGMNAGDSGAKAHAQAVGVVLVIGAGKEAHDAQLGGTGWSWRDMTWNLIGALLGGALVRISD